MGEMHGGGETTREDLVIYGEVTGEMIDKATDKLMMLGVAAVDSGWGGERYRVRTVVEQVVWEVLREVEDNGPW